ncbi:uncharacterized protein LOC131208144 [Anopheles bellator]|uniref:uncharacterized protein LOC131208144 n=1 Tax=Anopheles bellator TaxID=139047 RepID=UPI00264887B6|nr:uncharacterized protein LOC131208144 [Anopheles bellator]
MLLVANIMCRHRLVTLLLIVLTVAQLESLPVSSLLSDDDGDYDSFENEYDVVFDQRQTGKANVHVSVDGVLLALPAPEAPSTAVAGATLLDLFASQLATGGSGSEYDISEESHETGGPANASSTPTKVTTSTTSSTTEVPSAPLVANDLAYQASLPASLLGQGLSFLFTNRHSEIPFRVNPNGAEPTKQTIPVLLPVVDAVEQDDSNETHEDDPEAAVDAKPLRSTSNFGKRKRKHKRKYKVPNFLRPLLKRTVLLP